MEKDRLGAWLALAKQAAKIGTGCFDVNWPDALQIGSCLEKVVKVGPIIQQDICQPSSALAVHHNITTQYFLRAGVFTDSGPKSYQIIHGVCVRMGCLTGWLMP